MNKEGGIILGTGGDNTHDATGYFFEGVMTFGLPTDAVEDAVQANIVTVGYSGLMIEDKKKTDGGAGNSR
jgi:hypothetical protein